MRMSRARPRFALAFAALLAVAAATAPGASAAQGTTLTGSAGGFDYEALVPAADATRALPVLYIVGGQGNTVPSILTDLDVARAASDGRVIVVVVAQRAYAQENFVTDWADGSNPLDTTFISQLLPAVESRVRTPGDRAHRAIAGYSAGGYSSMALAARHPDRFAAAAAFSGVVDILNGGTAGQAFLETTADYDPTKELFRRWGNPYSDPLSWEERNPTSLARNLRGMSLYFSAGDGLPADAQEVAEDFPGLALQMTIERDVRSMSDTFAATLGRARIDHRYVPHRGTHNSRWWKADLVRWWPQLLAAFGASAPATFDFQSAAPAFAVWGWSFAADPARAREFLVVRGAGRRGITLIGSGRVRVTTARIFPRAARVRIAGAGSPAALASAHGGRLSFAVDLGAPHRAAQDSPAAVNQTPPRTRRISFTVLRSRRSAR
jgi:S-formylglutathione hydrolase FrmB